MRREELRDGLKRLKLDGADVDSGDGWSPAQRVQAQLRACAAAGLPARNYARLKGETVAELEADARDLAEALGLSDERSPVELAREAMRLPAGEPQAPPADDADPLAMARQAMRRRR
jgi:hypothetical protein